MATLRKFILIVALIAALGVSPNTAPVAKKVTQPYGTHLAWSTWAVLSRSGAKVRSVGGQGPMTATIPLGGVLWVTVDRGGYWISVAPRTGVIVEQSSVKNSVSLLRFTHPGTYTIEATNGRNSITERVRVANDRHPNGGDR